MQRGRHERRPQSAGTSSTAVSGSRIVGADPNPNRSFNTAPARGSYTYSGQHVESASLSGIGQAGRHKTMMRNTSSSGTSGSQIKTATGLQSVNHRACWNSSTDKHFCRDCGIWFHHTASWENHEYERHGRDFRNQRRGRSATNAIPPSLFLPNFLGDVAGKPSVAPPVAEANVDDNLLRGLLAGPPAQRNSVDVGILSARIHRGTSRLPGKSDSYYFCTCEILGKQHSKIQTPVVRGIDVPTWNHHGTVADYNVDDLLFFAVWDKDRFDKDELLGSATLSDKQILPGFAGELRLSELGKGIDAFLKIQVFQRPASRIKVVIINARGLRRPTWKGVASAYCICHVPRDMKLQVKTHVHNGQLDAIWHYEGEISEYIHGDSLELGVWDKGMSDNLDYFLGGASLTSAQLAAGFDGELPLRGNDIGINPVLRIKAFIFREHCHIEAPSSDDQVIASIMSEPETDQAQHDRPSNVHDRAVIGKIFEEAASNVHDRAVIGKIFEEKASRDREVVGKIGGASLSHDVDVIGKFLQGSSSPNDPETLKIQKQSLRNGDITSLKISIISAQGLRNADFIGKSDPYCKCEVVGRKDVKIKTQEISGSTDPIWNHTATISDFRVGDDLEFTVWDKDVPPKQDDFLGKAILASAHLLNGFQGDLKLVEAGRGVKALLKIKVEPSLGGGTRGHEGARDAMVLSNFMQKQPSQTPHVLKVSVISARGLRNADILGTSDPYCCCRIVGGTDDKVKTPVVSNTLAPIWNYDGVIKDYMLGSDLEFTVWDKDVFPKKDDFLGKVVLPSSQVGKGFQGELKLLEAGSGINAFLKVMVRLASSGGDCDPKDLASTGKMPTHMPVTVANSIGANPSGYASGSSAQAARASSIGSTRGLPFPAVQPIHVSMIRARGLRNADLFGKSDPYCCCRIVGNADIKLKTQAISGDLNPVWNYDGVIGDYVIGGELEFSVWDKDVPPKKDDFLGKAVLTSARIQEGYHGELKLLDAGAGVNAFLTVKVASTASEGRLTHDGASRQKITHATLPANSGVTKHVLGANEATPNRDAEILSNLIQGVPTMKQFPAMGADDRGGLDLGVRTTGSHLPIGASSSGYAAGSNAQAASDDRALASFFR